MSKRDEFITFVNDLKATSSTISTELYRGLHRQAETKYELSVEEASEILKNSGLNIEKTDNYLEILELSIKELQNLNENAIVKCVEKAYNKFYQASLNAGARPRRDGRTEEQWRDLLNQARDTLMDPHKREAYIAILQQEVDDPLLGDGTPIFKFPNGDEAFNIPQLAKLILKNSKDATDALYRGYLEQSLGRVGEMRFADAARSVGNKFTENSELGLRVMISILQEKIKFKNGREARTPTQLANAIDQNWEEAKKLLFNGFIELWFKYTKQQELAEIARDITKDNRVEQDIGVEKLVQRLNPRIGHPKLQISHESINFGTVDAETQKKIQLEIKKVGRGFLYGNLRLIGDIPGLRLSTMTIRGSTDVIIELDASHLTYKKEYETELVVSTNIGDPTASTSQYVIKAESESTINTNVSSVNSDLTIPISCYVDYPIIKFPNGDEARNIPQLAKLMEKNSEDAADTLYSGYLEKRFNGIGDMHLADAARSVIRQFPNNDEFGFRAMVSILQEKIKFKNGRETRTPTQLANAIDQNWEEAKKLLFNGFIELWFKYTKQQELAEIARDITKDNRVEQDIGVEKLVQRLNPRIGHPKLQISHESINFGTVDAETQKKIRLRIKKVGRGFLYGRLRLTEDVPGLRLSTMTIRGNTDVIIELDASHLAFNKKHETELIVTTNTDGFREAPLQNILKAKSIVNTNVGGITGSLTIPISCYVDYPIIKFPNGDEARNIRQLARLMLENPKDATDALYSGYLKQRLDRSGETFFADAARSVVRQFPNNSELRFRAMVSILQEKIKFKNGRETRTPTQLANAIDQNWEEAKKLLFNGFIELWFKYTQQPELAEIARDITKDNRVEQDIGVEKLVQRLNPQIGHPKLQISHESINFGTVDAETQKKIRLRIKKVGRGFLYGRLRLTEDVPGLRLSTMTIRGNTDVIIELDASRLAYKREYETELIITTNTDGFRDTPLQSILKAKSIVNINVGGVVGDSNTDGFIDTPSQSIHESKSESTINTNVNGVTHDSTVPISLHNYYPILKSIGRVAVSGASVAIITLAVCLIILLFEDSGWLATRLTNANFATFDANWVKWSRWLWTDWTIYRPKIVDASFRFVIALAVLVVGVFAYGLFFFKKRRQP